MKSTVGPLVLPGMDEQIVARGRGMFNGKAVCFGCHGLDGDIAHANVASVAKLNPRPTDVREPSDKSVRQLYLIIKYGIPNTGMIPVQDQTGLSDEDLQDILLYVLWLQGTDLPQDGLFEKIHQRDGEEDQTIWAMCDEQTIGDFDAKIACDDHYTKRYRDLVVGRPADIPKPRYTEIQVSCKQRFKTNLDALARCYRTEYAMSRETLR